jgi:tetratricopeptide (TPR) repeat protein
MDVDDPAYVTRNPYVLYPSLSKLAACFTEVRTPATGTGYYQPLTTASLMLDRLVAGGEPGEFIALTFHCTNILLHSLNAAMVCLLTGCISRRRGIGLVCGLLFAAHPLNVEAVSWVCQRKTVLSTAFALLALLLYGLYARTHRGRWYVATLAAFVLSLLAKPTGVLLPIALLLADIWPLRRWSREAVLEKLPFILVAAAACWIAVVSHGQTLGLSDTTLHDRPWHAILILCQNIGFYATRMVAPIGLCPMYPLPGADEIAIGRPAFLGGVACTLVLLAVMLLALRRRWTSVWVCLAAFLLLLAPTLSPLRFMVTLVADRFAYLPMVALLVLTAAGLKHLWPSPGARHGSRTTARRAVAAVAVVVLAAFSYLMTQQQGVWKNSRSYYQAIIERFPTEPRGYCGLGNLCLNAHEWLTSKGSEAQAARADQLVAEALRHYEKALSLDPDDPTAHFRMAQIRLLQGRPADAMAHARRGPDAPRDWRAEYYAGLALEQLGDNAGAVEAYESCVDRAPAWADALRNLASLLLRLGRIDEALPLYERLYDLNPNDADVLQNWAVALLTIGETDAAIARLVDVDKLRTSALPKLAGNRREQELSRLADARYTLAGALAMKGQVKASLAYLKGAASHKPELLDAAETHPAFEALRQTELWRELRTQTGKQGN